VVLGAGEAMRRREFIAFIGSTAIVWHSAVSAQHPPAIGFLSANTSDAVLPTFVPAFLDGLSESGFIDGQNVAIEYRWASGQYDRLPALAGELVRRPVNVIVAVGGTSSVLAAKAATSTIPVIFGLGADPVKLGLVASLNRPGGNMTGVSYLAPTLVPKLLEILHEALPNATVIAVIVNPNFADRESALEAAQAAARTLGQKLVVLNARTDGEINSAFKSIAERQASALVVLPDPFFTSRRQQLVALAAYQAIPTIYAWPEYTAAGGLMSYGTSLTDAYRQVGVYTAKVLKGAKPAELPVQEAVKVELILNLKTAKSLGITFPLSLLGRVDKVIE
jgi:putative tryptophan/tyrosine transport system substrate-binding protein